MISTSLPQRFTLMRKRYIVLLIIFIHALTNAIFAQNNVGIGTKTPATDAALDIVSKNKGLLVPRLTTAERLSITAISDGLLVYDTDRKLFFYWVEPAKKWEPIDDLTATNELIQTFVYNRTSHLLTIQDAGGSYTVDLSDLKDSFPPQILSISRDTIFLTRGGFVKLPCLLRNCMYNNMENG